MTLEELQRLPDDPLAFDRDYNRRHIDALETNKKLLAALLAVSPESP